MNMDSSTSQDITATDEQSRAIEKKRNWTAIIISSVFGGAVAVIAAPTIAALMPVGLAGFIAGTTATGMLGSITTRVTGNAIDSSKIVLTINQYPIQQFYRETVVQYIGTTLESVITAIRTNRHLMSHNQVFFEVGDEFRFEGVEAKEQRRMFFDFSFNVVPLSGTPPRPLDYSIPAPVLPVYERESTCSMQVPSSAPDHAVLFVEFATEVQHQVNRLARCALGNGVGLELNMKIGSTTKKTGTVELSAVAGAQHYQLYWSDSKKVNLT